MVVLSVMVELYVLGFSMLFLSVLGFMAFKGSGSSRHEYAVGFIFGCLGLLVAIWIIAQDNLSSQMCVATVTAQEGWEDMSLAEIHSAAEEAVEAQPVAPNGSARVKRYCFSELQAQDQPNSTTSED